MTTTSYNVNTDRKVVYINKVMLHCLVEFDDCLYMELKFFCIISFMTNFQKKVVTKKLLKAEISANHC